MNILDYLEEAARLVPERIALEDENGTLTFAGLRKQARQVGAYLCNRGIGNADTPIGVMAGRNKETIVLYMGILYSGNYYVPMDPDMKEEKKNNIIEQSGMDIILSPEELDAYVQGQEEEPSYAYEDKALDKPLYMVFTSGSTGVPKGVLKTHGAMRDYAEAFSGLYPYEEHEVLGNQTPFFFDASAKDIYLMLRNKATMVILATRLFSFPVKLIEYMNEKKITIISWVPSALSLLTQLNAFAEVKPTSLKKVYFVGEVFPMKQLNRWRKELPDLTYVNLYGSSEIAGVCLHYQVKKEDVFPDTAVLPMGKPLPNCKILLRNQENGQIITEPGVSGEIYLASGALAKEYFKDPEKTENSFVWIDPDGAGKQRYFKTGDVALYNEEGDLVFSSRKDFQIKHMGHRIELGEIEVAALALDYMEKCGCIYDNEKKRIVLYCQVSSAEEITGQRIKADLTEKLSSYMVPNRIVLLDRIPLNANGKTDRMELQKIYCNK